MKKSKNKTSRRLKTLVHIFFKEQISEPIAILWTIASPCAFFYFLTFLRSNGETLTTDYTLASSWFYAYIASSTALFGCSFYLIGRRESGFVRSFIYQRSSIALYLCAHIIGYSLIALCYGTVFYLVTRPAFGAYSAVELATLLLRFFICYTFFSSVGLLIALLPLKFSTASTLFSIASFMMLSLSYLGATSGSPLEGFNSFNPLIVAQALINNPPNLIFIAIGAIVLLLACSWILYKFLRIQPVWSRY